MTILLTGGSGLLGTELQKHIECYAPSHDEFDIDREFDIDTIRDLGVNVDLIVHCAAYTDVVKAEEERNKCYRTNVLGTKYVAMIGVPMVYISTEYVFGGGKGNYMPNDPPDPINFYALTKLLGEGMCSYAPSTLIIRTLFKPRPFEHPHACTDQWTSGDYIDVISSMIVDAIKEWDRISNEIIHIGTGRKSTYELAKQSRPDVKPCLRSDIKSVKLPMDTSLAQEWREFW